MNKLQLTNMEICGVPMHLPPINLRYDQTSPFRSATVRCNVASEPNKLPGLSVGDQMFFLGMGFVGQFFAADLKIKGWMMSGSCTSTAKKEKLENLGYQAYVFDANNPQNGGQGPRLPYICGRFIVGCNGAAAPKCFRPFRKSCRLPAPTSPPLTPLRFRTTTLSTNPESESCRAFLPCKECRKVHFPVGILRPNFLDGANYLGQAHKDGFFCNVWEKVDFIWYYEDVATNRHIFLYG